MIEQDGLLAHCLLVLLLVHLLEDHWLISLEEQGHFSWMQFHLQLEHCFGFPFILCFCLLFFNSFYHAFAKAYVLKKFQCHCPERTYYDNWASSCWYRNWHFFCYRATLHIWGCYLSHFIRPLRVCMVFQELIWWCLFFCQISPTEIRGALGSINQLFICIGILLALVAGLPLAGNPIWYVLYAFFSGCVCDCYA